MSDPLPRAVAVVGPTAAGKTKVGVALAAALGRRVMCCDSVQVFRHLDIGSAKPTSAERSIVAHTLIDLVDPDESFSAGDYERRAHAAMENAPGIFVGGTGFYLRAVAFAQSGDAAVDAGRDDPTRLAFEREWLAREAEAPGAVHRALDAADPETAREVHPRNVLRALRAFWLCERYGEPVSAVRRRDPPRERLSLLLVVVDPGVEAVDRAIDERCDRMIAAGWLREVEMLHGRGYDARHRSMQSLGYKQLLDVVEGHRSLPAATADIKQATRRYARRQRTYFRHQFPAAERIELGRTHSDDVAGAIDRARQFLSGDPTCPPKS